MSRRLEKSLPSRQGESLFPHIAPDTIAALILEAAGQE